MLNTSKNINISGSSSVEIEGRNTVIMTMNAQISDNESYSVNKYIQNKALYDEHKADADADYAEFEEYVYSIAAID